MAIWYVWSGATGTGTGASWTNAKTTLQAAITAGAAGDTYYVANDHAETAAAATTITFKGTASAIDLVFCVNRAGSVPPVSADLTTGGSITTTGANALTLAGTSAFAYIQGLTFNTGSGAVASVFSVSLGGVYFKNCSLKKLGTTAAAAAITIAPSSTRSGNCILDNTTVTFGAAGDSVQVNGGDVLWKNTSGIVNGGTTPTTFLAVTSVASVSGTIVFDGVDFSALGSGKTIIGGLLVRQRVTLINCKLGASVTISSTPTAPSGTIIDLIDCDSGTLNYRNERYWYQGTLTTETVVVPSSQQASDGTTPITWKVVTTANVKPAFPFETFTYGEWCDTTGSALTRTFEIINDGTTLTNADVWAEVQYLGSSATPVASLATSGLADLLASGSSLTSSSAAWTTTGITTPTKQVVAVTFTPQMKGFFRIVFKVAKASKTIWINPRPNEV